MQIRFVQQFDDLGEQGPHPALAFNESWIMDFHATHHQPILRAIWDAQIYGIGPCVAVISITHVATDGRYQLEHGGSEHYLPMRVGMKILHESAVQFWVTDKDMRALVHQVGNFSLASLRSMTYGSTFNDNLKEAILHFTLRRQHQLIEEVQIRVAAMRAALDEQVMYSNFVRGLIV